MITTTSKKRVKGKAYLVRIHLIKPSMKDIIKKSHKQWNWHLATCSVTVSLR